jgi:hypothetical protein
VPQIVGWDDCLDAFAVQDAGFEFAVSKTVDDVGFVADFQGADGSLPHAFEFEVATVRGEGDSLLGSVIPAASR